MYRTTLKNIPKDTLSFSKYTSPINVSASNGKSIEYLAIKLCLLLTVISISIIAALSIFVFKMSNYSFGTCPYNKEHRIMLFRMPGHIVKCMKNYRGPPLQTCKYNAIHRVLDMEEHLKECEDYHKFTENNSFQMALSVRAQPIIYDEEAV